MSEKHPNREAVLVLNAKIREALAGFAVEDVEIHTFVPLGARGSQLHYRSTVGREDLYVLRLSGGNPSLVDWEDAGTLTKIQIAKALPRLREGVLREMEQQCHEVYEAVAGLARFLGELEGAKIREKIEKA